MKIALLGYGTVGRGVDEIISSRVPGVEVARILELPDRLTDDRMTASFDDILADDNDGVLNGSASASCEDGSDYRSGDFRCAVRVYERYSWTGGNRVSLSMTLAGRGEELFLSAITSGGSQAMFFKVNTWGEEAFLDTLLDVLQHL